MSEVVNVFRRYEKKFLLTKSQRDELLPLLRQRMQYDEYCPDGQPYIVRNIYYDTVNDDMIRLSIEGPPFKEKIRVRKYGRFDVANDEVFIEIKRKYKGIGIKRRVRVTDEEAARVLARQPIDQKADYYSNQILREVAYLVKIYHVVPAVFMSYSRLAFIDRDDPQFRLTIDDDILTRRVGFDFSDGPSGTPLLTEGYVLMEVKVGKAMPLWFAQALSQKGVYLTSYSKYGKEFESRIRKEIAEDV